MSAHCKLCERPMTDVLAYLEVILDEDNILQVGDPEIAEAHLVEHLNTPDNFDLLVRFGPNGVKSVILLEEDDGQNTILVA